MGAGSIGLICKKATGGALVLVLAGKMGTLNPIGRLLHIVNRFLLPFLSFDSMLGLSSDRGKVFPEDADMYKSPEPEQ